MVQNGQTSLRDFSNGHLKLSLSSWDLMSLYPSSSMAFPHWVWIKEMLENDILSLQAKAVAEEFRDVPYVSRSKLSLCREPRVWVWRYWEIESVHGRDKKLRSRLVSSWGSRLRSSYLIKVIFPGWSFCNFLADSISSAMSWHVLLGQGFGIFNYIWEKAGLTEQCTQSSTVARCIWDLSHLRKPTPCPSSDWRSRPPCTRRTRGQTAGCWRLPGGRGPGGSPSGSCWNHRTEKLNSSNESGRSLSVWWDEACRQSSETPGESTSCWEARRSYRSPTASSCAS